MSRMMAESSWQWGSMCSAATEHQAEGKQQKRRRREELLDLQGVSARPLASHWSASPPSISSPARSLSAFSQPPGPPPLLHRSFTPCAPAGRQSTQQPGSPAREEDPAVGRQGGVPWPGLRPSEYTDSQAKPFPIFPFGAANQQDRRAPPGQALGAVSTSLPHRFPIGPDPGEVVRGAESGQYNQMTRAVDPRLQHRAQRPSLMRASSPHHTVQGITGSGESTQRHLEAENRYCPSLKSTPATSVGAAPWAGGAAPWAGGAAPWAGGAAPWAGGAAPWAGGAAPWAGGAAPWAGGATEGLRYRSQAGGLSGAASARYIRDNSGSLYVRVDRQDELLYDGDRGGDANVLYPRVDSARSRTELQRNVVAGASEVETVHDAAGHERPSTLRAGAEQQERRQDTDKADKAPLACILGHSFADKAPLACILRHSFADKAPLVCILGHSYVHWAAVHATADEQGVNLGFSFREARIRWLGKRGMRWGEIVGAAKVAGNKWGRPDLLIVHLGGNDIGLIPTIELQEQVLETFKWLHSVWPDTRIVWSNVISRLHWSHCVTQKGGYKGRKKLNQAGKKAMEQIGGVVLEHPGITALEEHLFGSDGENLSEEGIQIFLEDIKAVIRRSLI